LRTPPLGQALRVHLYLHVPYCAAKCPYCDFNSVAGKDEEHSRYVTALLTEVRRLPRGPYDTVFIGGGTPTKLGAQLLEELLVGVRGHITLADGYEWTCEANPGSADVERFRVLSAHGVNRLSLGVQSTTDERLRFLGRVHSAGEAEQAVAMAMAHFPRVSADLIMGLPGQDRGELEADLAFYRRHGLSHASVYHLAYEPGTEFHARRGRGELQDIDPELSQELFAVVWDGLEALGLAPYETSNFARPGQESRHNVAYWQGRDYQAAGAGAVSTLAGLRTTREKHSGRYCDLILGGEDAIWRREFLSQAELLNEAWMLGLRLTAGLELARVYALGDREERWRSAAAPLLQRGLILLAAGRILLTRAGRVLQDEITVQLLPG
jgi:putative oxygen-independent coproporphyrinogen III oxidase